MATRSRSILKKADAIPPLPTEDRGVCWGDMIIYEFPNILGDNPGVSDGAPLSIAWKHDSKSTIGIDYYEYLRQNRPRRRRKELVMPSAARDTYLLGIGYRLDQIISAAEETKKIRKSRHSNMKGKWDNFKKVFDVAAGVGKFVAQPRIVAGKSA